MRARQPTLFFALQEPERFFHSSVSSRGNGVIVEFQFAPGSAKIAGSGQPAFGIRSRDPSQSVAPRTMIRSLRR